jgi:hypothetical protein
METTHVDATVICMLGVVLVAVHALPADRQSGGHGKCLYAPDGPRLHEAPPAVVEFMTANSVSDHQLHSVGVGPDGGRRLHGHASIDRQGLRSAVAGAGHRIRAHRVAP